MSSLLQRRPQTGNTPPSKSSSPRRRRAPRSLGSSSFDNNGHDNDKTRRRRKHKNNKRTLPFAVIVALFVGFWLLLPILITRTDAGHKTLRGRPRPIRVPATAKKALADQVQAIQRAVSNRAHPGALAVDISKTGYIHHGEVVKSESELIDMRQLNQELAFDNPDGGAWKQGWDVTPQPVDANHPLQIFVLPHSHCDPGWIKTFDEYFQDQTKSILTTVIKALEQDAQRKFIWAEISYFEWWWREQTSEKQASVRTLLKSGQLEFVTGGWVQPDEANTQLYAMEVQLQEGHDFIRATFGEEYIPKYGWSIDPFGYSPTMAYLLQKYGFEGMLIQRVHYAVKKELAQKQHLEFMWRQTWDEKGEHDIFTHTMPFFSYDVPHTCGPDPSVCCQFDFARMDGYGSCPWHKPPRPINNRNVKERAMLLLDQYQKKAALYRSNVVLAPLGDDFRYTSTEEAEAQYTNYQKIFDYLNENVPGVQAQFGTLSDYFNAAMGKFDVPILKGSFFTYADRDQDYWSGYFTSRVFDKALDRKLERVLYAADSLGGTKEDLQQPRRALSLFQHHDGVTGTAKNHVVEDYAKRIHTAIHDTQEWVVQHMEHEDIDAGEMQACWQSDAPRGLSQNLCQENTDVALYNPLSTSQFCGDVEVEGHSTAKAKYPCDYPGGVTDKAESFQFDSKTGLMTHPIKEQWMVWKVTKGGAYLFHPGTLDEFKQNDDIVVEEGGYVVTTGHWKRTLVERQVADQFGKSATVLDFVYETNLQNSNEEWFVRFGSDVSNEGVFHTDLNGFNFDTHHFRKDMPIQSQVFPMPTLASIEDSKMRMTILSEHAQGTASLQDGSIDVWLDRRLRQDDQRGLGQGVQDNVPTRTRLRVVLEEEGFQKSSGEFDTTPLCKLMWEELNHPLEAFGVLGDAAGAESGSAKKHDEDVRLDQLIGDVKGGHGLLLPHGGLLPPHGGLFPPRTETKGAIMEAAKVPEDPPVVPFVYMVYNRLNYFKESIESLRKSDVDTSVPIIVSHDGHVSEMVEYVETLKTEFPNLIQLIHPFSCHDHPKEFPGNDASLNQGYKGDTYANQRSWKVTCAKHHFTWMLKTVFELKLDVNAFLFLEEDYLVASNIYENLQRGLHVLKTGPDKDDLFGLALDPTDGHAVPLRPHPQDGWFVRSFVSGPMVLTREMFNKILKGAKEYCNYDDYNWDWSLVHLMDKGILPPYVATSTVPLVKHIGVGEGLHEIDPEKLSRIKEFKLPEDFHGSTYFPLNKLTIPARLSKPFGGWGHPKDQGHCRQVLGVQDD